MITEPSVKARKNEPIAPLQGAGTVRFRLRFIPDFHPFPVPCKGVFHFRAALRALSSGLSSRRGMKAMRSTDKSAQLDLGTGTSENRLSTYEAFSPRYGDREEEWPWNSNTEGRIQVMACPMGEINEEA